ncbi:MAG: hypothetical protein K2G03_01795, partial [Bacilli bacterium]|nr:hypothetical protein [Bacilli bacterium]
MGKVYENLQKEEKREIDNKRNILIADKVCEILKSKLLLNRTILEFSKSEEYLNFEEFCNRLNSLIKKLETLEKDNPNRQYVEYEYNNFVKCYAKKVILNDQEIDKLLEYVRNSIVKFGICQNQKEYSSSELVKFSLNLLKENINQNNSEENKELISWINFITTSPESGFLKKNDVQYEIKDDGQEYFIIKEEGEKIFAISMDGDVSIDEELDYQNSLLDKDLYIGCIDYEGERIITILYQKDGNYYPVFFNQESSNRMERIEQRLKQNAKAIISLSSLLEFKGLSHLIEPIYDKKILEYIALTINEKGYSMDKLITSNLEYLEEYPNEEIPSDELYITKSGIIRQNKNSRLKEERQKNSAELNEVLKISGLSSLIEESYDIKKLEYIMLSLKDNLHKIPSIVTEPAPPQKHLLTEIFYDVFYNLINPVEKKSIKENEDHLSHSFVKPLEKKVIRGIDDGLLEKKLGRLIINVMGYSVYNKYR